PADVLLRGLHAAQVHLRERTEAPQAADRDLVATLDHGRHLALDRDAGLRRHGQRLPGLGALAQLVREPDLIAGRHHGRFDLVADGHAELALAVGQLGALDPGFALAPDVDEHAFGRDLDDAPFHNLPDLEHGPGGFTGEQGPEVLSVAHASTLGGRSREVKTDRAACTGPGHPGRRVVPRHGICEYVDRDQSWRAHGRAWNPSSPRAPGEASPVELTHPGGAPSPVRSRRARLP